MTSSVSGQDLPSLALYPQENCKTCNFHTIIYMHICIIAFFPCKLRSDNLGDFLTCFMKVLYIDFLYIDFLYIDSQKLFSRKSSVRSNITYVFVFFHPFLNS